jgi:hypothetical protein
MVPLAANSGPASNPQPAKSNDPQLESVACAALGLGWQMAELYDNPLPRAGAGAPVPPAQDREKAAHPQHLRDGTIPDPDLPGVSELTTPQKVALRLDQIDRGLRALGESMSQAGVTSPTSGDLRRAVEATESPGAVRKLIEDLHVKLLSALTVADYRLGKAYGLGRALCDTSRSSQSLPELHAHLEEGRLENLISWCEDLKTLLPGHTGQAVAESLRLWQTWSKARSWPAADAADVSRRLHLQGQRWRAVLTGEKNPLDVLTIGTYVQAGEQLLGDAAAIGWGLVKKFWLPVAVSLSLLIGGLIIILLGSGNNVFAGLASIVTGLGISWKTITPNLTNLARKLGNPLWGAELDSAILVAITDPAVREADAQPSGDRTASELTTVSQVRPA